MTMKYTRPKTHKGQQTSYSKLIHLCPKTGLIWHLGRHIEATSKKPRLKSNLKFAD